VESGNTRNQCPCPSVCLSLYLCCDLRFVLNSIKSTFLNCCVAITFDWNKERIKAKKNLMGSVAIMQTSDNALGMRRTLDWKG